MVPELPEELEALPGDPLAPEVSVARRSHPTAVKLKAASTNKIFEVFLRMFMPVPFMKMAIRGTCPFTCDEGVDTFKAASVPTHSAAFVLLVSITTRKKINGISRKTYRRRVRVTGIFLLGMSSTLAKSCIGRLWDHNEFSIESPARNGERWCMVNQRKKQTHFACGNEDELTQTRIRTAVQES
jgi:hypothetical protein